MRLFLALDLDATVRAAVGDWVRALTGRLGSSRAAEVKFVEPRHLHLTLLFLGEVAPARADLLRAALGRAWPHAAFDLALRSPGTFPAGGHPRVLWLGVAGEGPEPAALHRTVQARARDAGFGDAAGDRPFAPHLTIGRVRRSARPGIGRELAAALAAVPSPPGRWRIDRLTLYESVLSSHGPHYEPRAVLPLAPAG